MLRRLFLNSIFLVVSFASTEHSHAQTHENTVIEAPEDAPEIPQPAGVKVADPCSKVESPSPSAKQQAMITHALNNKAGSSQGLCAKYVKNAMLKGYPEMSRKSSNAYSVDTDYNLTSNGFKKCDFVDPRLTPAGCIIIYDSFAKNGSYNNSPKRSASNMRVAFPERSRKGFVPYYGHIEIKTPTNYVSDFLQGAPIITGSPQDLANGWGFNRSGRREYKVIGIFCKR